MTRCDVVVEGARYAYGEGDVEALRGVSLRISGGEAVALLGKNGAGKTTLTRLLVALLVPRAGRVSVGGWDVATRSPDEMARRVGYVFQHADQQLFARTVREDVVFGPRQLRRSATPVAGVLEELELQSFADVHPYDVPAPLRKLVALAGVLASEPELLVLDEPTAGLGREQRELVVRALRRRLARGVTVLAVSHDLPFVAEAAERTVVMSEGAVVADRPTRDLLHDAETLRALELKPPPAVAVAQALALPGNPVRAADVIDGMRGMQWKRSTE